MAKASAILAVSGGLVATVAAPSSAAPLSGVADGGHQVHVARHAAPAAAAHRAAAPAPESRAIVDLRPSYGLFIGGEFV
ncbi:hypothetical protein, partial [Segeticoccus rhizosphaerae]|uniref:hypothetical protein n=1 Tax=Segeticoccus rhizosphaerae TaxID=1104777 RepID=UPI0010C0FFF3